MRASRVVSVMLGVALMACAAHAGADTLIEDFDGCPAGVYNAYGGVDLGEVGTLTGWEIGGRYVTITNRDGFGDMDAVGNHGDGSTTVATTVEISGNHGRPVFDASEALDMSQSTYVKNTLTNNSADSLRWGTNGKIRMYYRDATDSTDKYVEIAKGWGYPDPGDTWTHTDMLDTLTGFDKTEDLVFGFWMNPNSTYAGAGLNPYPTWNLIEYDVPEAPPIPEPGSAVLLLLGGLGALIRRKRRG